MKRSMLLPFVVLGCFFYYLGSAEADSAAAKSTPPTLIEKVAQKLESSRKDLEASIQLSNGYRSDDFDWNVGCNDGECPNILSELKWTDLDIYEIKGSARVLIHQWLYLRGSVSYGSIEDGKNQDSDYLGDDRTFEFSRSFADTDGHTFDTTLGGGIQFRPKLTKIITFTPLVGWSYHEQNLRDTNGVSVPTEIILFELGPFEGLNSKYEAEWEGPWVGIDLSLEASSRLTFYGTFEYHFADYDAKADWNLRGDFAHPESFTHTSDGEGFVLSFSAEYVLIDSLLLTCSLTFQDWSTDSGRDRVFQVDGTAEDGRLNEVNWESWSILGGLSYRFW